MKKTSEANKKYWQSLSASKLTDEEIKLFEEQLDWKILSSRGNYPHETWMSFLHRIAYESWSMNPRVEARSYQELSPEVYWNEMACYRIVTESFFNEIGSDFPTVVFLRENSDAKLISNESWERRIGEDDERLHRLIELGRKEVLMRNIHSMEALSEHARHWDRTDWGRISLNQPLTFEFVKNHILQVDLEQLKRNPLHGLSATELEQVESVIGEKRK